MGMDNLPEPGPQATAEITIEIEGVNHPDWQAAFAAFKQAVRTAIDALENSVPPSGGKKIRTGGSHKKKRS